MVIRDVELWTLTCLDVSMLFDKVGIIDASLLGDLLSCRLKKTVDFRLKINSL